MNRNFQHKIFFFASTILLFTIGCSKSEIPSYIAISDTLSLSVNGMQGTSSQKITDAWVYAGNDLIGAFELPKTFPLLKSGSTQITVYAGIKMNGINETRVPYPFYAPIIKTVTLEQEKVTKLAHLKFAYAENTQFAWQEDFEGANLSIEATARSEVNFTRSLIPDEAVSPFPGELNMYAAKVVIPNDTVVFECKSHDGFALPTDGKSVFLELNYKSNNALTMGIFAYGTLTSQRPVFVLNPSTKWNKIYINLTPTMSNYSGITSFGIYFSATKTTDDAAAEIYFDNIKLLHF